VESGPDLAPVDQDDFSVSDPATGEGGPLSDIQFDYDQSSLTDAARATLEKHALWLQGHREARVTVEGHCDERGTAEYNLALGDERARAARNYLVQLGVDSARLRTVSYGKERPLDPGANEAAWARNRRAHFLVAR
jgi:peptidoglycan-associated lipoprotein